MYIGQEDLQISLFVPYSTRLTASGPRSQINLYKLPFYQDLIMFTEIDKMVNAKCSF